MISTFTECKKQMLICFSSLLLFVIDKNERNIGSIFFSFFHIQKKEEEEEGIRNVRSPRHAVI